MEFVMSSTYFIIRFKYNNQCSDCLPQYQGELFLGLHAVAVHSLHVQLTSWAYPVPSTLSKHRAAPLGLLIALLWLQLSFAVNRLRKPVRDPELAGSVLHHFHSDEEYLSS